MKSIMAGIRSVLENTCYAKIEDQTPQQSAQLVTARMDAIITAALDKWQKDNNRTVSVKFAGAYPIDYVKVMQNTALYDQLDRKPANMDLVDVAHLANRFRVASSKMACQPSEDLLNK